MSSTKTLSLVEEWGALVERQLNEHGRCGVQLKIQNLGLVRTRHSAVQQLHSDLRRSMVGKYLYRD